MRPTRSRKAQLGRSSVPANGPDDAEALGGVVEAEPDHEHQSQVDRPGRRRLTDGETLGEIVEPDAGRDHHRERLRGGERVRRHLVLGDRSGSHAEEAALAAALHDQLVEVDEAHEADEEADDEDRREADEAGPGAVVIECRSVQRGLDGLDAGREDVPEEEEQDARRRGAQERARRERHPAQTSRGQAEEDGQSGDRAEDQDLLLRHADSSFARFV